MTEKDYAVYRYLEQVAEENPNKWVSKEELINEFPQYFVKGEDSHDICSTLNMVRLNINRARASGKVSHLVLLKNHQFKLAVSKDEAEKSIQKDYNNAMKLLKRYWQNRGAIKEDGQGKLIDCNGQVITEESLAKRFQMPFDYGEPKKAFDDMLGNPMEDLDKLTIRVKKYKLSELLEQDSIFIHTPKKEQDEKLRQVLDEKGYTLGNGDRLISFSPWGILKDKDRAYCVIWKKVKKVYYGYLYFATNPKTIEFVDIDLEN
jgi:hypothetical protein